MNEKKRGLTAWERWELATLGAPEPEATPRPRTSLPPRPAGAREAIWQAAHWQRWLPDSFDEPPPPPLPPADGGVLVDEVELPDEAIEIVGPDEAVETAGELAAETAQDDAAPADAHAGEESPSDDGEHELAMAEESADEAVDPASTPQLTAESATDADAELPTAEAIEAIFEQAREEGYTLGYAVGREEGFAAGKEEGLAAGEAAGLQAGQARIDAEQAALQAEAAKVAVLAGRLEDRLGRLEHEVADELLALAVELARQVVRGELAARPAALIRVVREALAQLPHQHAVVWLHPQDAALVRAQIGEMLQHAGHRVHEDAALERGDCLIEAGGSQLDATLATRWRRVLEQLGLDAVWAAEPDVEVVQASVEAADEAKNGRTHAGGKAAAEQGSAGEGR